MAGLEVEGTARLIQHQYLRLVNQGASDQQAAPLSVRQLSAAAFTDAVEVQLIEQIPRLLPLPRTGLLIPAQPGGPKKIAHHRLFNSCFGMKPLFHVARHNPQAAAQRPEVHRLAAKQPQMSVGANDGIQAAVDQFHQAAFACAIGTQHRCGLPQFQLQVEFVQHRAIAQPCLHIAEIEPGFSGHGPPAATDRSRSTGAERRAGAPAAAHSRWRHAPDH